MTDSKRECRVDVYVLRSLRDHDRYIGLSASTRGRLAQHNAGKVKATKGRRPFVLTYKEQYATRQEAREREKYLKSGAGRRFLDKIEAPTWLEYLNQRACSSIG
ncbi:MAG: GIY-YIG nuclease family protein [Ignavibacteria bacterium]|nr:GIY-YIG nuclease family protein [Ignavibacteria bacterium]